MLKVDEHSSLGVPMAMTSSESGRGGGVPSIKAQIESFKGKDEDLNRIECYLETDDLWKQFHELGTEMIITKSGRYVYYKRIFWVLDKRPHMVSPNRDNFVMFCEYIKS